MDGLNLIEAAGEPGVAERIALVAPGVTLSYGALSRATAAFCGHFQGAGVGPGVRVAILSQNRLGVVVAIHALLALGAVLVPIHPRLTEAEVAVLLEDARPALVVREADLAALEAMFAGAFAGEAGGAPRGEVPVMPAVPVPASPEEGDLAILYTSGTTGRPKGAVLSRRAFVAAAAASAENLGFREDDRWLLCLPLCHVGGLSILTRCLLARRTMILVGRFAPEAVLSAIVRERATLLSVVPTMLTALLDVDEGNVLARLRAILVGGAGAPERVLAVCAGRGVPALTTYGLTEACSQVTSQQPRDPAVVEAGSGRPLPGTEVRIGGVDGEGVGRIQVKSASLFRGYWRGADLPPEVVVDGEGWFDTGDLGCTDAAGRLQVLARRTDLIVTGGENVYPVEVERAIEACTGVSRALVFGVADDRWGQIVAAAVVPEPAGGVPSAAQQAAVEAVLAAELQGRLASHKRPRLLAVVEELPVTPAGKLDRARAVARLAGALRPLSSR
ncbi:class I adenylate-forming enzyme family protein [Chondromyces apiculatus]|uniref:O-succinylbenzoic acid--CoA ligase n=1 Tax=Chondromyces apiculatus DSM 436 TaxID=1192034 RepID=A0A017TG79_9BACT|nr:AMP-binding protein [Chondromyces apiculatus]EYF07571.1 O-succinylbenzoic acid--CoA ligase [Chondromyces apiculatus DSM 436]